MSAMDTEAPSQILPYQPRAQPPPLQQICEQLAQADRVDSDLACSLAGAFIGKHARQTGKVEDEAALILGAFRFLQESRPERVNVAVSNPEEEGWNAPLTIVRAMVGDRPFVVDSIREYLTAQNLAIHRFVHPVLLVERDDDGRIVSIGEEGGQPEAFVHCELTRIDESDGRAEIRAEIEDRLELVVAATDDFPAMLGELRTTAEMMQDYAQRFPDRSDEFREVEEFLNWLQEDNFVFLDIVVTTS